MKQLSDLKKSIDYYKELDKRKEYVLKVIEGLGKLTSELKANIIGAVDWSALEDLFLPYKPSRKTRAAKAREAGLDSLALKVLDQKGEVSDFEFSNLICEDYPSTDDVRQGVSRYYC
jgi:uncharacterized protein